MEAHPENGCPGRETETLAGALERLAREVEAVRVHGGGCGWCQARARAIRGMLASVTWTLRKAVEAVSPPEADALPMAPTRPQRSA